MEENENNYGMWYQIFIIVDLICCGAIILPIIRCVTYDYKDYFSYISFLWLQDYQTFS